MAANIGHSLYFSLFLEFFSLLLLGFLGKAFGCSFKFMLVYNEKVARSTLREIWLRQDVLHSRDWTDFTLIVDVLELVHFVRLVDDPVAFLEVHQLVCLRSIEDVAELAIVVRAAALLALLGNPAGV